MKDYKHRSKWPEKPVSGLWENLAGGLILAITVMSVIFFGFMQATGGL